MGTLKPPPRTATCALGLPLPTFRRHGHDQALRIHLTSHPNTDPPFESAPDKCCGLSESCKARRIQRPADRSRTIVHGAEICNWGQLGDIQRSNKPVHTRYARALSSQPSNHTVHRPGANLIVNTRLLTLGQLNQEELSRRIDHFIRTDASRERLHNQFICAIYSNAFRDAPEPGVASWVSANDKPTAVPKPVSGDAAEQRLKTEVMQLPARDRHRLKGIPDVSSSG